MYKINKLLIALILTTSGISLPGCRTSGKADSSGSVKEVIDNLVTRLYDTYTPGQMDTISHSYVLSLLTDQEKQTLAGRYWVFRTNVPVRVSLMRHDKQEVAPFWLEADGFVKTALTVKSEMYTYEVWQKDFPAGEVNLGINGFDKHRPVYFVSVRPKSEGDNLVLTPVIPENQHFEQMMPGAFTYHDWDGLTLTEVPDELKNETLLTTIRGRARESHVVNAFRETPFPSSKIPDQALLTRSGDPTSSIDIQWRTNIEVAESFVQYWKNGAPDTLQTAGVPFKMEDRLLRNDRYIYRHTAKLTELEPGSDYGYRLGNDSDGWTTEYSFRTAPAATDRFSYIWFGDVHNSPVFGDMLQKTRERHPDVHFYQLAGDLVNTGLHRDDWDKLFGYSKEVFGNKVLMSIPGNHDSQDGLGAWMYKEMFSYPENGPAGLPTEMTYSYEYGNALFLMIDATLPMEQQTEWIENQLSAAKTPWKFVMFHFPPYNFVEPYPEIIREWGPLFDKYHVDMVMGGHMHYYLRTKPIYADQPVESPSKGTIYLMSVGIEGKQKEWPEEDYAVVRYQGGPLYQHMTIAGNRLDYICYDPEGNVKDKLSIVKDQEGL